MKNKTGSKKLSFCPIEININVNISLLNVNLRVYLNWSAISHQTVEISLHYMNTDTQTHTYTHTRTLFYLSEPFNGLKLSKKSTHTYCLYLPSKHVLSS